MDINISAQKRQEQLHYLLLKQCGINLFKKGGFVGQPQEVSSSV